MDTDLAEHFMDLKQCMARIEERTSAIHDSQEKVGMALIRHDEGNRRDFHRVDSRFIKVEKKQNWTMGVGSAIVFVITVVIGLIGSLSGSESVDISLETIEELVGEYND